MKKIDSQELIKEIIQKTIKELYYARFRKLAKEDPKEMLLLLELSEQLKTYLSQIRYENSTRKQKELKKIAQLILNQQRKK